MLKTFGVNQITPSGYMAVVDRNKCKGCGTCVEVCQFTANTVTGGKSAVRWEACFGCGQCATKCPNGARILELDERKGLPLDVRKLVQEHAHAS
jgi:NAD-dependent dihydropyrimidine dehydrogenase PreA subunit